jgi:protein-S-isoprenylcysteine O-methyltransferase Ste14
MEYPGRVSGGTLDVDSVRWSSDAMTEPTHGAPVRDRAPDPATELVLSRAAAAVVTVLSFPFGPGLVLVLIPWLTTKWHSGAAYPVPVDVLGIVLIALGTVVLILSFVKFPAEGEGTPFPTNPPSSKHVIAGGPYRYVRNPIYVAFTPVLVGMALVLARPVLLVYAVALIVALCAFVHWYEEPTMRKKFGASYEEYRARVPGWLPRIPVARR